MNNVVHNFDFVENGSVSSPAGFTAAGITAGLKKSGKPDFAMLFSEQDCNVAGTFTSNLFPAAPVQYCRERVSAGSKIRAVIVNSGVANACTGKEGYTNTVRSAEETAAVLGIKPENVLTASTGRIGVQLPMDLISKGIRTAAAGLSADGGIAASHAIMTTDTKPKSIAISFDIQGKRVTIGGMTKGAGMIAPGMIVCRPHATMLCFLTTDAEISANDLSLLLESAVEQSFNRITVDNDMSTNDTCVLHGAGRRRLHQVRNRGSQRRSHSRRCPSLRPCHCRLHAVQNRLVRMRSQLGTCSCGGGLLRRDVRPGKSHTGL